MALAAFYAAVCLIACAAAVGAWAHRQDAPAAFPLAVVALGLAWCAAIAAAGALAPRTVIGPLAVYLRVFGIGVVIAAFACESRAVVRGEWKPTRRGVGLLAIHPAVVTAVALTDPWHHLFATFPAGIDRPWPVWVPGPLYLLHLGYCYVLLGRTLGSLAAAMHRAASPLHRRQLRSVFLAGTIPAAGSLAATALMLTRKGALPDLMPLFVLVTGGVQFFAVFRQGLLGMLPVARELVVDNVSDAILVVDTRGIVVDLNPAAGRLARHLEPGLPARLVGLPLHRVLPPSRQHRAPADGEYQVSRPAGDIDLDLRVSDLVDRQGRPLGQVLVARDVTELNEQRRRLADVNEQLLRQLSVIDELREELAELAVRDDLTGLHNRRHLMAQLEIEIARARSDAAPLAVVLLDIDHFKAVNDRHGHAVGDILLTATAHALASAVRLEDTVARYGGEEFVVILPGKGLEDAIAFAESVRTRCSRVLVSSREGPVSATISVGVASFPDCGWTSAALLQSADDALYVAKGAGRDRVVAAIPA